MNMPFFSVIMPVYNAERFLSKQLDCILSQSLGDFELIVVNDGSTDSTSDILTEYAREDCRLKSVHKENEGVSVARNCGLQKAEGLYVFFVDADDILFPGALQLIADVIQNNPLDYLRFEYKTINEEGKDLYPNYEAKRRRMYAGKMVDAATCLDGIARSEFFLWSGVFRREIIEANNIRFSEGCTYNEDTLFMVKFFCCSETHSYLDRVLYGYRKYSGAVTAQFSEKNFRDVMDVFFNIVSIMPRERKLYGAVKRVSEMLGRRLMEHSGEFDCADQLADIRKICLSDPVTLDWKLFGLFGTCKVWKVLDLYRKVAHRLI